MKPGRPRRPGRMWRLAANLLLLLVLFAWEMVPRLGESPGTFSVQSWNMEWFPSGYIDPQPAVDEAQRIRAAARIMRRQGVPDIFFAQEIRDEKTCLELLRLLNRPDFKLVECSRFTNPGSGDAAMQQLAIFSRFPAVDSGHRPWSAADFVYPPRGYTYAILQIGDSLVACFNVHLKSNYIPKDQDESQQTTLNRLKRELSSQQLMRHVRALAEHGHDGKDIAAFVIAGDFNTSLQDPRFEDERTLRDILEHGGFSNAFEGLTGDMYATLPATDLYPAATFDHILHRGLQLSGRPFVYLQNPISDHRSIRARFKIPAGEAAAR